MADMSYLATSSTWTPESNNPTSQRECETEQVIVPPDQGSTTLNLAARRGCLRHFLSVMRRCLARQVMCGIYSVRQTALRESQSLHATSRNILPLCLLSRRPFSALPGLATLKLRSEHLAPQPQRCRQPVLLAIHSESAPSGTHQKRSPFPQAVSQNSRNSAGRRRKTYIKRRRTSTQSDEADSEGASTKPRDLSGSTSKKPSSIGNNRKSVSSKDGARLRGGGEDRGTMTVLQRSNVRRRQAEQNGIVLAPRRKVLAKLQALSPSAFGDGKLQTRDLHHKLVTAQEITGHKFKELGLLRIALLQASASREVLSWLGDSLLYFLVTEQLAAKYPRRASGSLLRDMHRARERLVSRHSCALRARRLGLDSCIVYDAAYSGQPYFRKGGSTVKMAAELMEAVIGAMYVDGGIRAVHRFFLECFDLPEDMDSIPDPSETLQDLEFGEFSQSSE